MELEAAVYGRASYLDRNGSLVVSCGCWAPGLSAGGDAEAICSDSLVFSGGRFGAFLVFVCGECGIV